MQKTAIPGAVLFLCLGSCVGTDFVTDPVVTIPPRIEINQSSAAVQTGGMFQFQAAYYDSLGVMQPLASYSWSSSDTSIASVDQSGLALGKEVGQAMIQASANGITSVAARLTVVADPTQVARVVVMPATLSLSIGASGQLTAAAENLNGEAIAGKTFNWRSTNTAAATVDESGAVTAIASGTATVIASTDGVESAPVSVEVMGQSRTGTFSRRPGTSYSVAGTAILEQGQDGLLTLRFGEDFACSDGPGLQVFLSPSNTVNSASITLGSLKSTAGTQSYDVPESTQLSTFDWVIIHCVPFNVTFGYAQFGEVAN